MKKFKDKLNNISNTEKVLASLVIFSISFFSAKAVTKNQGNLLGYSDENSEFSQESEESSTENDEFSEESLEEPSTPSVEEISTPSIDEISTPSIDEESVASTDEISTPSDEEYSTVSEVSEKSIRSGDNIRDISQKVELSENNIAYAYEDGNLFFLIPVKIEKQLSLDESGNIIDVKQSLLNRILDILSN